MTTLHGRGRRGLASDRTFGAVVVLVWLGSVVALTLAVRASTPSAADAPPPQVVVEHERADPTADVRHPPAGAPTAPPEPPALSAPEPLRPQRLHIATLGVDAPVVPVGLEPDDSMEIPADVRTIGWYDPDGIGVRPGEQGTAVLASHVDSRSQGRGVLFPLHTVTPGETFAVELEDGSRQTWVVTEVAQIPKDAMPMHEIFTWTGRPRVVLITCGGDFDRRTRGYVDNIVVYAVPS